LISGTGTGAVACGGPEIYSIVKQVDISKNQVVCTGPVAASSEAMTHAMVYAGDAGIQAVLHIHSLVLWEDLLWKIPTTPADAAYGTPQMARAVQSLFDQGSLHHEGFFAMAGHREGLLAFGETICGAFEQIVKKNGVVALEVPGEVM
jgi:hypothetical protein